MTDPVFFVIPRPQGRGLLLDHIRRHGITAPNQPTPHPVTPGDTHQSPPRYDPPHTRKPTPRRNNNTPGDTPE